MENQPPPPPTLQPGTMISAEALAVYLKTTNPGVNWEAALAGLSQVMGTASTVSGTPATSIPPSTVPTSEIPSTAAPDLPTPTPTEPSQETFEPPETPVPSPKPNEDKPLDVSPLLAYQDPGKEPESTEGEKSEKEDGGAERSGRGEAEPAKEVETPIAGISARTEATWEVDLNELAKKQGLTTDDEFQTIMDGRKKVGENATEMAEGPDLASKVVRSEAPVEPASPLAAVPPEPVGEAEPKNPVTPSVAKVSTIRKPKPVKRKLVLKDEPKEKQKQRRVSQRCLGRGITKKTGAATASKAVEISSEEEGSPTKPGEDPDSTTTQKESHPVEELETTATTGQEKGSPTKPGEDPSASPFKPVEEVTDEARKS